MTYYYNHIDDDGKIIYEWASSNMTPEQVDVERAKKMAEWVAEAPRRLRRALRKNREANKPRKNPRFVGPEREMARQLMDDTIASGTNPLGD